MSNFRNIIESNPNIMLGKPIIKGTRITVEVILRKLSEGYTPEDITKMYPHITLEGVYACMAYAAAVIGNEAVIEIDKAA